MSEPSFSPAALVLYKKHPARVDEVGTKIAIQLPDGKTRRVRPKDITLLHPGPLNSLDDLAAIAGEGDVADACELLEGGTTTLPELAELVYGAYTPASAWAAWRLLDDQLYFSGSPEAIRARSLQEVEQERRARTAKAAEKAAWNGFLQRLQEGRCDPEDGPFLEEVEQLALGTRPKSRVMQALGREQTPESAHALLLHIGHWQAQRNIHPLRLGLPGDAPAVPLDELLQEDRTDLTHLKTFAIDDEGNQDPDDALSLDGERLWVHVADAAALVPPDSAADREARNRSATLYLPERTAPMLPPRAVEVLGLGLHPISPALSFGLDLDADGRVTGLEIVPSRIRVQRLSYQAVEQRLQEPPFHAMMEFARKARERRKANGAVFIDLPEVDVKVKDGQVLIRPQPALESRVLVSEAMLLVGEAVARHALEHDIPFPFATQAIGDIGKLPEGMAGMVALRRCMRPRQQKSAPEPHMGLGMETYTQATSPLRRYLDLVVHQQLRAHLSGRPLLDQQQVLERVGMAEAMAPSVRKAERLSRTHWTLVWLRRNRNWSGEGILVNLRERRGQFLIPELGLETTLRLRDELPLNSVVRLRLVDVDLPNLEARFKIG